VLTDSLRRGCPTRPKRNFKKPGPSHLDRTGTITIWEVSIFIELAFKYADSSASQSRARTCQSFAFYYYGNPTKSRDSLQIALEIDSGNSMARILIADFDNAENSSGNKGKGKKGKSQNKANGKGHDKGKKVGQKNQFDGYFLVEPRG
jgi:hypothetical protein